MTDFQESAVSRPPTLFEPQYEEFSPRTMWELVQRDYQRFQEARSGSAIQSRYRFIEGPFRVLPLRAMPFHKRYVKQEWSTKWDLPRQSLAGNFRIVDQPRATRKSSVLVVSCADRPQHLSFKDSQVGAIPISFQLWLFTLRISNC